MSIIVTGGCGYVGSFVVQELLRSRIAKNIVVLDDLSSSVVGGSVRYLDEWRSTFFSASGSFGKSGTLYVGNCANEKLLRDIFAAHAPVIGVVHLAAHSLVEQSVCDPLKYYENNLGSMFSLLNVMRQNQSKRLVFSSSCTAGLSPSLSPSHAYGDCKQWGEQLLSRVAASYGFLIFVLRLFNVCGASKEESPFLLGELHDPETHIIPAFLRISLAVKKAVDSGKRSLLCDRHACIRGCDYETPDGTCIRDYIHVEDVAKAHVSSLAKLLSFEEREIHSLSSYDTESVAHLCGRGFYKCLELGSGCNTSVKELIGIIENVTGYPLPVRWCERRKGDLPKLVLSDSCNAHKQAEEWIDWKPFTPDIQKCVQDTWRFMLQYQKDHPDAFST